MGHPESADHRYLFREGLPRPVDGPLGPVIDVRCGGASKSGGDADVCVFADLVCILQHRDCGKGVRHDLGRFK
jgi:hypothetical protein